MTDVQILLIVLVLIFSSCLEGINNSLITARQGFDAWTGWIKNEHVLFVLQRSCFPMLFFILLDWRNATILSLLYALQFSFFHNGSYNESMRKLGNKNYSWTYTSSTSTAKLELNFVIRTFLLILAVLILTYRLTN